MKLPGMIEITYLNRRWKSITHYTNITMGQGIGEKYYVLTTGDSVAEGVRNAVNSSITTSLDLDGIEVSKEEYYRILNLFEGFENDE